MSRFFTEKICAFGAQTDRKLPWKATKNPYTIWISEIILQQTRVAQGLKYYERFLKRFPTVDSLAAAPQDDVLKLWEGLGYYSRARNLHFTAKYIVNELNGQFPKTYKDLLKLKGVGAYTAAAIASFAYDLPEAVVDGNVIRVLSRYLGIKIPFDTTEGKKAFQANADKLLNKENPALYNQAIMDFGATICTPKKVQCNDCPLQSKCYAFKKDEVNILPIKSKKIKVRDRFFNFLVIENEDKTWIQKREGKDIWQNLYQFPILESEALLSRKEMTVQLKNNIPELKNKWQIESVSQTFKQKLSHQTIYAQFFKINTTQNELPFQKIERKKINNFAFPKVIVLYLKDNSLLLF